MNISGISIMNNIGITELWKRLGTADVEDEKDILADERGTLSEQERKYLEQGLKEAKNLENKENSEDGKSSQDKESNKENIEKSSRDAIQNKEPNSKDSNNEKTSDEKSAHINEQYKIKNGQQGANSRIVTFDINNFNKDVNAQENKIVKD